METWWIFSSRDWDQKVFIFGPHFSEEEAKEEARKSHGYAHHTTWLVGPITAEFVHINPKKENNP